MTFSLRVHPTMELVEVILGWGSGPKVVKPDGLRAKIMGEVEAMAGLYGD